MPSADDIEEWKDVPGTNGFYQASTHGRIKSTLRTCVTKFGVVRTYQEKIFNPPPEGSYAMVDFRGCGKKYRIGHHVAICRTFHGVPATGMEACHNDGNVNNNRPDNLRWGTEKDNAADRKLHGTEMEGSRHGLARLSEADVIDIRRSIRDEIYTGVELSKIYGVSCAKISQIKLYQSWKHVA